MIEIKREFEGRLVDQGLFNIPQKYLDECMEAITNARGNGGQYRIRVQWLSDEIRAARKAGKA